MSCISTDKGGVLYQSVVSGRHGILFGRMGVQVLDAAHEADTQHCIGHTMQRTSVARSPPSLRHGRTHLWRLVMLRKGTNMAILVRRSGGRKRSEFQPITRPEERQP